MHQESVTLSFLTILSETFSYMKQQTHQLFTDQWKCNTDITAVLWAHKNNSGRAVLGFFSILIKTYIREERRRSKVLKDVLSNVCRCDDDNFSFFVTEAIKATSCPPHATLFDTRI